MDEHKKNFNGRTQNTYTLVNLKNVGKHLLFCNFKDLNNTPMPSVVTKDACFK